MAGKEEGLSHWPGEVKKIAWRLSTSSVCFSQADKVRISNEGSI